jgi:DNA-binding response OmpR family regulator
MRVMIVENEVEMAEEVAKGLHDHGFKSVIARTGHAALEGYASADVVLLHMRLPDLDGFAVCSQIRRTSDVPILVGAGHYDELDCVLSLKLGADDYVVKPYKVRELAARMEAVLRRATGRGESSDGFIRGAGPVQVDLQYYRATVNDIEVSLTPKEFGLLALLLSDPGKVFTRDTIMREVWKYNDTKDTRTLSVHVAALRKKLKVPHLVETIRGVGYRFNGGPDTSGSAGQAAAPRPAPSSPAPDEKGLL